MKKIILLSVVAVLVLSLGIVAFADNYKEAPQWYNDMIEWKKEEIQEAVKNGEITEEYAKQWNEEMDHMKEYNEEYGYNSGHGRGYGMMGRFGNNDITGFRENRPMGGFGPGFCHR